jgi:hypothetical protein
VHRDADDHLPRSRRAMTRSQWPGFRS